MYSEPEWSQATTKSGFLEILKEGKIIGTISIPQGTKMLTFGRLPENIVTLDHDSISRNHAVLQFGPRDTAFIYDLGSSHGTFLNKKQLLSGQYVRITSGNAMIRFGASSRCYILNLEENLDEETASASGSAQTSREYCTSVSGFFSEHEISFEKIEVIRIGNLTSCSLDFSEYVSIDSSETSRITSTGASKEEALDNFYEDSYNFLSRLGFIDKKKKIDYKSDSEHSDDDFYNYDQMETKKSNVSLSENELLTLRNHSKSKMIIIQAEIDKFLSQLDALEHEVVDDFDVFVQDLKKDELKKGIEKRKKLLEITENEFLKYQKILAAIGYKEMSVEVYVQNASISEEKCESKNDVSLKIERDNAEIMKHTESVFKKVKMKIDDNIVLTETESENNDTKEGIIDFEDSTLHDEQMDLSILKRKYGY